MCIRDRILSFCFWGLVPFHAIFAVTVWKDILFSGFMLLYLCFLYELLCNPDNRPGIWAGLSLSGFFVCTLRSNGLYIFLFTLPFVLFAFRRTWKKMFAVQVGILPVSYTHLGNSMDRRVRRCAGSCESAQPVRLQ